MADLKKRVIVVSPHSDDETLGAGGTIARLIDEGNEVFWLNITSGKDNPVFSAESLERRARQEQEIERFYGFSGVYHLELPNTNLDLVGSFKGIGEVSNVFKEVEPQVVILPDYNDVHMDHKCTYDWCHACTKSFRYPSVKQVMTMEIISETDFGTPENPFVPNCYVDISDYMDRKIEALKIYDTELGTHPFPRSIENIKALATVRGATAGVRYAEAFRVVKMIV
jgi:LmbE family N-acetylglucosaminyl deacetylase